MSKHPHLLKESLMIALLNYMCLNIAYAVEIDFFLIFNLHYDLNSIFFSSMYMGFYPKIYNTAENKA